MFEKVKKKYVICISLTDFPEPPSVLASMLYHFEPDNDFAIGRIACETNIFNHTLANLTFFDIYLFQNSYY
jgi:hypothetical protein